MISSIDDCLHAFWYCTDNISKWPDNETFCRQLFAACEERLPTPIQGKYKNHVTSSTTEAVQTTESITTTLGKNVKCLLKCLLFKKGQNVEVQIFFIINKKFTFFVQLDKNCRFFINGEKNLHFYILTFLKQQTF